jgi:hypothetical protein
MVDWIDTALPIATLILGSGLTMAGQALRDRRAESRERAARREGFMVANFEVHRSGILEMQRLVQDCHRAWQSEDQRRNADGFYAYFADGPEVESGAEALRKMRLQLAEVSERLKSVGAGGDREEALAALDKFHQDAPAIMEATKRILDEDNARISGLFPFWQEFAEFIYEIRLCMMRSGNNNVIAAGEDIAATFKWSETYGGLDAVRGTRQRVLSSHARVGQALADALKYGPYDQGSQVGWEKAQDRKSGIPSRPADGRIQPSYQAVALGSAVADRARRWRRRGRPVR